MKPPYAAKFNVRAVDAGRWGLLDERGQLVFVGTMQQCEDWLDWNDNHATD